MANKKISEFPITSSLAGNDAFLINHIGTTSTVSFSTLSAAISNVINNFIPSSVYDGVPIGSVYFFAASTPPAGYLECNGSIVSKTTYSELWSTIGDTFSAVSLSANDFRLPDLRGEFIRGWDNGKGVDTDRVSGSNQDDMFESHNHNSQYDNRTPGSIDTVGAGGEIGGRGTDNTYPTTSTGGTETRPRNISLLPCIKATKQLIYLQ